MTHSIRTRIRQLVINGGEPITGHATITGIRAISPSFTRVTFVAPELAAYEPTLPADGVKILIPGVGKEEELRGMTVANRPSRDTVEIDVLRHAGGILGPWVAAAQLGDRHDVIVVRREYALGDGIDRHLIVADASALPAAATIIRSIPPGHEVTAWIHAPSPEDAAVLLPHHPRMQLLLREGEPWAPEELRDDIAARVPDLGVRLQAWIAAEAATIRVVRRHLTGHGLSRDNLFAAAYWKEGRDSTTRDELLMREYMRLAGQQIDVGDPDARLQMELALDADEQAAGPGTGAQA